MKCNSEWPREGRSVVLILTDGNFMLKHVIYRQCSVIVLEGGGHSLRSSPKCKKKITLGAFLLIDWHISESYVEFMCVCFSQDFITHIAAFKFASCIWNEACIIFFYSYIFSSFVDCFFLKYH